MDQMNRLEGRSRPSEASWLTLILLEAVWRIATQVTNINILAVRSRDGEVVLGNLRRFNTRRSVDDQCRRSDTNELSLRHDLSDRYLLSPS